MITYYVLTAAPGERNAITVERRDGGLRVTDTGAPLSGCAAVGPGVVQCPRDDHILVLAGDGDDTVLESGDDASSDTLDGGPGRDTVLYADRSEPVAVDLAAGVGGQGSERDALRGFENVWGGNARDILRGDDGPNALYGVSGGSTTGDVLDGRGGDDRLQGSSGPDELAGGPGADELIAFEGADRIRAGAGRDEVLVSTSTDADISCGGATDRIRLAGRPGPVLHADCERVRTPGALLRLRHRPSALRVTVAPRKNCRLRLNGRRSHGGTVSLAAGTGRIMVRCGTAYAATAFRLTS